MRQQNKDLHQGVVVLLLATLVSVVDTLDMARLQRMQVVLVQSVEETDLFVLSLA